MLKELTLLIDIQALDTQIIKAKELIEKSPDALAIHDESYVKAKEGYDAKKEELDKTKRYKKELDSALEDASSRIDKLKARSSTIKTNKEYQTHIKEIEQAESDVVHIEDEILAAMEKIEEREKALKLADAVFKKEEGNAKQKTAHINEDVKKAHIELDGLLKKRQVIANLLEGKLHDDYLNTLERMDGIAVAKVDNSICYGCFMNIPPQVYVEVMRNDKLYKCPQCGRYLYYANQSG
ncbi:MAG: C4-type zinc ribbon domain-containing protein [Candidatus Magnetoovum sp. WYHC-5]|nr:C4-type zinc ribbon domain-containing protein [Candidatus Magnetoovum sp. WYHC-5]